LQVKTVQNTKIDVVSELAERRQNVQAMADLIIPRVREEKSTDVAQNSVKRAESELSARRRQYQEMADLVIPTAPKQQSKKVVATETLKKAKNVKIPQPIENAIRTVKMIDGAVAIQKVFDAGKTMYDVYHKDAGTGNVCVNRVDPKQVKEDIYQLRKMQMSAQMSVKRANASPLWQAILDRINEVTHIIDRSSAESFVADKFQRLLPVALQRKYYGDGMQRVG